MAGIERFVDGQVYTAKFLPLGNDHKDCSVATAIIEPPFVFGENDLWLSSAVAAPAEDVGAKATMSHMLSTRTRTAVEIEVTYPGEEDEIHDHRIDLAYAGLQNVVRTLNEVETGTYTEK